MTELDIRITLARPEHSAAIYDVSRLGYSVPLDEECGDCPGPQTMPQAIERFPAGQFVALAGEAVVGYGITMRTGHSPEAERHVWSKTIGDLGLRNHDPAGDWLYLVDFVVRPDYQGQRIGRRLFEAANALARRLGLKGAYGGGMLGGYYRYRETLSLEEYAEKVRSGELNDPTVSAELKIGFEAGRLLRDYAAYDLSDNAAMLIVWRNPDLPADESDV